MDVYLLFRRSLNYRGNETTKINRPAKKMPRSDHQNQKSWFHPTWSHTVRLGSPRTVRLGLQLIFKTWSVSLSRSSFLCFNHSMRGWLHRWLTFILWIVACFCSFPFLHLSRLVCYRSPSPEDLTSSGWNEADATENSFVWLIFSIIFYLLPLPTQSRAQ